MEGGREGERASERARGIVRERDRVRESEREREREGERMPGELLIRTQVPNKWSNNSNPASMKVRTWLIISSSSSSSASFSSPFSSSFSSCAQSRPPSPPLALRASAWQLLFCICFVGSTAFVLSFKKKPLVPKASAAPVVGDKCADAVE